MSHPPSVALTPRCRELRFEHSAAELEELRSRLTAACTALGLLLEGYHAMNVNWLASLPGWLEEHVVPDLHQTDARKASGALALAEQLRSATDRTFVALEQSWQHIKQCSGEQADPCVVVSRASDPD